jgi:L-2-hydroxyglutarate oxidase LhgO
MVGLASALSLHARHRRLRIGILEKEPQVALHQTEHNSGVIHGGIYYKPGSLKARLCVEGSRRMRDFCDAHGIRYERCGKVVVATDQREVAVLEELYCRGTANGVPGLSRVGSEELRELEPYAAGVAALHSPNTVIVDYVAVARAMADDLCQRGVDLLTDHEVTDVHTEAGGGLRVFRTRGELVASYLLNCAGLYSDVVARKMRMPTRLQIVPFRGEYYFLRPERQCLVHGLIYPVPDPDLPFLGVHFTRNVHGQVEAGPNAVLAFAREGYARSTVQPSELLGTLAYPGFWRLARRY